MKRSVIVNDIHFPFEHKAAYKLFLRILKDSKASELVLNGDILDCYNLSNHIKNPEIKLYFEEEIEYAKVKFKEIRSIFKKKIVFLAGNHCSRMERQLSNQCPHFFKYIDLPKLLELESLGIEWIPFTPNQQYNVLGSKLIAKHTPIGNNAQTTINRANCSVIFGHNHQIHENQKVTLDGHCIRGISNGCLVDKNNPSMQYVASHHQWNLGFSVVTVLDNGIWLNQNIHIIESHGMIHCLFDGKVYEASIS